jgi:H+/Cl- antiporter ClcA
VSAACCLRVTLQFAGELADERTTMPKFLTVLLGCLLGAVAGLVVAVPILVVLNAADVTTFKEDLPLHGWIPFVATVYGCALVGGVVGQSWVGGGTTDQEAMGSSSSRYAASSRAPRRWDAPGVLHARNGVLRRSWPTPHLVAETLLTLTGGSSSS